MASNIELDPLLDGEGAGRQEAQMTTDARNKDERACERIPFDAMVEVGGSLGPSFEAQAVDLSEDGMHLRTAYLPEIGQPIACRFDAGAAGNVLANGEVVWKQERGKGGEFGIRFMELDGGSAAALERIVQLGGKVPMAAHGGPRVRLHLEGLGSPIRGRVRGTSEKEVTVGSELGFLQVGKGLELEDSESGERRPAHIDRVEVEVDPESRIPRLVIALRYDDVASLPMRAEAPPMDEIDEDVEVPAMDAADTTGAAEAAAEEPAPETEMSGGAAAAQPEPKAEPEPELKGPIARGASKVAPALEGFAKRAKTAIALLAAKRFGKKDASGADGAPRRTTSPPPGGALHANGRKVVRAQDALEAPKKKVALNKKHVIAGAGVGVALIAAWALLHKPTPPAAPPETVASAVAPAEAAPPAASNATALNANLPPIMPSANVTPINVAPPPAAPPPAAADHKKPGKVTPFGNLGLTHGNVLRLKMDGPIDKINGAPAATGFLVSIPGHKSLEPAGPLAARDARIASIKVSNDASGAELEVAFKDGVPQYQVRAKGDELEIVLASPGKVEDKGKAQAKAGHDGAPHKKPGGGHSTKH